MTNYGKVRSTIKPNSIEFDDYSVWINTDIQQVTIPSIDDEPERIEYEFSQIRYTKDEYLQLTINKNSALENQLTDLQLALCTIYESTM